MADQKSNEWNKYENASRIHKFTNSLKFAQQAYSILLFRY